jgi:hypothetical protein
VPAGKQLLLPLNYLAAHDSRWEGNQGPAAAAAAAAAEGVTASHDGCCGSNQGPEGKDRWSPDAFVPERMLTSQGQKTGDLMPFGYGARWGSNLNCGSGWLLWLLCGRMPDTSDKVITCPQQSL